MTVWLWGNAALLFAAALFGGSVLLFGQTGFCVFKVFFHLYCPFCGGTRALFALLRADLPAALRFHAPLTLFCFFLLFYDLRALILILRRRPSPFHLPAWVWWSWAGLFCGYFLLRNALLFAGIDLLGDFIHS